MRGRGSAWREKEARGGAAGPSCWKVFLVKKRIGYEAKNWLDFGLEFIFSLFMR